MHSPRLRVAWLPLLTILTLAGACGPGNLASNLAKPPEFVPKDQAKCGVTKSQAEPLIVEWPSASRAQLESKARHGGVVVHYVGCEMRVLAQCAAPGTYAYTATTRKKDRIVMRDADDLYANIPVGAAKFEATLARAGELSVDMVIVGRYEADRVQLRKDELSGDCSDATHVVSALTVGAFGFASGADADVSAKGSGLGARAGGQSVSKRELLNEDGREEACDKATRADKEPPEGCGALIRVEVVPLGEARAMTASCPAGTEWDGSHCMGKVVSAAVVAPPPKPSPSAAPQRDVTADGMVSIPAGSFWMGSDDGEANEKPTHRVSVGAFAMDVTEVTVSAYAACARAGVCRPAAVTVDWVGISDTDRTNAAAYCNAGKPERANHPINCVDWGQATAYCGWVGKRLPTEEEWEYAAHGGDGRKYPWGNDAPATQACWNGLTLGKGTCEVGSFRAGPFGLADMAGNVWEWTSSGFSEDYDKPRADTARVVRGCSWSDVRPGLLRGSARNWFGPASRTLSLGFRCAR